MKFSLSSIFFLTAFSCFSQINPPPPPPPPPPTETPLFIGIVEEMPRFPGCEDQGLNRRELKKCAREKLLEYIANSLVYPAQAKAEKETGMAVVQFTIQKDGTLADINTVRDPGYGMGDAASDIIKKMNTDGIIWIPGKQRDRTTIVLYTLPIKFALD